MSTQSPTSASSFDELSAKATRLADIAEGLSAGMAPRALVWQVEAAGTLRSLAEMIRSGALMSPAPGSDAVIEECARLRIVLADLLQTFDAYRANRGERQHSQSAEDARAVLSITPPAPVAPEDRWQPIETAPKDGKEVDLWIDPGVRVVDARWYEGRWVVGGGRYRVVAGAVRYWMRVAPPAPASGEGSK